MDAMADVDDPRCRFTPDVDGEDCFSLDSPRSIEACKRCGIDSKDLEERSEEFFKHGGDGHEDREGATCAVRAERHEITRHRLLREVKTSITIQLEMAYVMSDETCARVPGGQTTFFR